MSSIVQNKQIFNAYILVAGCPIFITTEL